MALPAYPAFNLSGRDLGAGTGPQGGPGPFAPGNTPVVYPKASDPVATFLKRLEVAGFDENGQPVGSTGGRTFIQDSDVQRLNELAGGNTFLSGGTRAPQVGNTFLPGAPTGPTPSPAPSNPFLGGTGEVRFNGLTPATLPQGGTPMLGRDYSTPNAPEALSTFGRQVRNSPTPIHRNGAIFSNEGGKLSITQDPNNIPAQGSSATAGASDDPLVQNRFTQLLASFAGAPAIQGDPNQAITTAAQGLKTDVPNWANLSEQERTAILADDQRIREAVVAKAKGLAAQGMLPSANQSPEARANRMQYAGGNAFLDVSSAREAISGKPREVAVGGERYVQYGNGQLMRVNDKPERTLVAGTQRTLEPMPGVKIEAEWDGRDWIDSKTGAQVWITPRDSIGNIVGNPAINPALTGGVGQQTDPLDELGKKTPPKKTDEKPRVKLTLKDLR